MINLLVTGSKGQLGSKIKDLERNYPRYNFFFTCILTQIFCECCGNICL